LSLYFSFQTNQGGVSAEVKKDRQTFSLSGCGVSVIIGLELLPESFPASLLGLGCGSGSGFCRCAFQNSRLLCLYRCLRNFRSPASGNPVFG
jgi:hypothetical protein